MSLPSAIQRKLASYYALEDVPDVAPFVEVSDDVEREQVLVRSGPDGVEVRVRLPARAVDPRLPRCLDGLCQVVEGVSHFVLIAERARRELPTTQLELELQAEVDKLVVLGLDDGRVDPLRLRSLRRRLYEGARYLDPEDSAAGYRYRLANRVAAGFAVRLEERYWRRGRWQAMQATLRRFYREGQTGKLELAKAA